MLVLCTSLYPASTSQISPVDIFLETDTILQVEELEYIDYSRTDEDPTDQFLDTFSGKPSTGATASEDDEDEMLMGSGYVSCMEFISREESFSYRCSTPNTARRHRGYFSQDVDLSGFNDLVGKPFDT